jgi:hypothetical protein
MWRKTAALLAATTVGIGAMLAGSFWIGFRLMIAPQESLSFLDFVAMLAIGFGFTVCMLAYDELKGKY